MNESEFRKLCLEVSESLSLPDVHLLGDFQCGVIDGMPLEIGFDAARQPDRLRCQFDLGEVPETRRAMALERLMRLNLLSGNRSTGVYALDSRGCRAVYAVSLFQAHERAPRVVAQALRDHAAQARSAQLVVHGQA